MYISSLILKLVNWYRYNIVDIIDIDTTLCLGHNPCNRVKFSNFVSQFVANQIIILILVNWYINIELHVTVNLICLLFSEYEASNEVLKVAKKKTILAYQQSFKTSNF